MQLTGVGIVHWQLGRDKMEKDELEKYVSEIYSSLCDNMDEYISDELEALNSLYSKDVVEGGVELDEFFHNIAYRIASSKVLLVREVLKKFITGTDNE